MNECICFWYLSLHGGKKDLWMDMRIHVGKIMRDLLYLWSKCDHVTAAFYSIKLFWYLLTEPHYYYSNDSFPFQCIYEYLYYLM